LRRWLGGEPVRARPARAWERGWRWARRRPAAAALLLASGVASLALVALAVLALSNRRLEDAYHAEAEARDDGEEARGRAEDARKAEAHQRQRAEAAREAEEKQRRRAEAARKAEAEARKREQAAAARAALFHYFHRIALAQAEWRAGNVPRA